MLLISLQKKAREELRLAEKKLNHESNNNVIEGDDAKDSSMTSLYESSPTKVEDSYELRNRVFVGSKK